MTSEQDESGVDHTQPNDIEYPEECPQCGFEPVDPDGIEVSDASDGGGQFWTPSTTLDSDGKGSVTVSCPDCGYDVVDITIDEKLAQMLGLDEVNGHE